MNNIHDSFKAVTDLLPVLVLIGFSDMLREILAPEIEKKLKRKMNDWDWQYYIRENFRRAEADTRRVINGRRQQRYDDMKVIHDFVWEGG